MHLFNLLKPLSNILILGHAMDLLLIVLLVFLLNLIKDFKGLVSPTFSPPPFSVCAPPSALSSRPPCGLLGRSPVFALKTWSSLPSSCFSRTIFLCFLHGTTCFFSSFSNLNEANSVPVRTQSVFFFSSDLEFSKN